MWKWSVSVLAVVVFRAPITLLVERLLGQKSAPAICKSAAKPAAAAVCFA